MTLTQDDLLTAFVEEALEHLSSIETDFLAIEKSGKNIDSPRVNKVFRAAHSIKGGAGFIGLKQINALSHKMETVLGLIRNGKLIPDSEIINFLLIASDRLKELVLNVRQSDDMDIGQAIGALNAILTRPVPESRHEDHGIPSDFIKSGVQLLNDPVVGAPDAHPAWITRIPDMDIPDRDRTEAVRAGQHIYAARIDPGHGPVFEGKSHPEIVNEFRNYGTVFSSRAVPDQNSFPDSPQKIDRSPLVIVFSCVLDPDDLVLLLEINPENLVRMDSPPETGSSPEVILTHSRLSEFSPVEPVSEDSPAADIISDRLPEHKTIPDTTPLPNPPPQHDVASTRIRVNISLLDSLMNLAGELVLGRNQLIQAINRKEIGRIETVGKRVDGITSELQKVIMLMRMQPVGNLFNKLPRMVRSLSREMGKEADLSVEGADVELDRTLLEAMSDPLTHLIRNAVDHGIEPPDARKKMGKGEIGKIVVRAFNEAGQVVIEVFDDGAGIDPEKMVQNAISKGFVAEDQARIMSWRDKQNLIFLPGFSSAGRVSDISGRGVGMDVVKTNLDNLGGLIDIDSTPGAGTRITIKLPLTLAIIPSQIISAANERFAIPQINIEELHRIPACRVKEQIEKIGEAEVICLRGELLPLIRLADILGLERAFVDPATGMRQTDRRSAIADRRSRKSPLSIPDKSHIDSTPENPGISCDRKIPDRRFRAASAMNIAVLSTGQIKYGLIVDAFHDAEEIVVKPLGRHFRKSPCYAGATIMGDGRVALILDVSGMAEMAGLFSVSGTRRADELARSAAIRKASADDRMNLLVFRNASDEQFALPLNLVIRIEKIRSEDIQNLGGKRTIQYRQGNLPVYRIDDVADVGPLAISHKLLVIVFTIGGRELGLLAVGPLDSASTSGPVDGTSLKQPGIMGSVILNGKTTLLVDLFDLVRTIHPDWFTALNGQKMAVQQGKTVLVAEDSQFFRSQIKTVIEMAGYFVVDVVDGEAAWQTLKNSAHDISLVVTDIEMPRMNGFELIGQIRKDNRFDNLPIIALTTLADDQDRTRALKAGVDEYHLKLDKEKLIGAIDRLIRERVER